MRQLPEDARASLVLRDDDWRLSFLQGNFVTLTNLTEDDFEEIVERHISPLRLSLHCITPEVRRKMIGKHAPHGIEMLERLLDAGIEFDAQIVLTPGYNDGLELQKTLTWAYMHPGDSEYRYCAAWVYQAPVLVREELQRRRCRT